MEASLCPGGFCSDSIVTLYVVSSPPPMSMLAFGDQPLLLPPTSDTFD